MFLRLEPESDRSLRRQIYEAIKALILAGELSEKEKLPSSRTLSKELGIARATVLEAYEQLLAEGYLESRQGSGTRVATGISPMRPASSPARKEAAFHRRQEWGKEGITFRSGVPDLNAFPLKEWAKTYQRSSERLPPTALQYGQPGGVEELREAIAAYLVRTRGIRVSPQRIMITSGSTQGLFLVSRLLRETGGTVLMEDPAHAGLVGVVARAGYALHGVRADESGLDTTALPAAVPAAGVAFVYTTPSHHYPLGGILPIQRRQALVRFAQENTCALVEDDYDSEFRYEGAPVSSLFELAPDTVIYLGSFSKILAPALRLGFAIIPESLIPAWEHEKKYTDVHTDALTQYALAAFIQSGGLERHIWKMKKVYHRKREYLIRCLEKTFGRTVTIQGQAAGLHLVASFSGTSFTPGLVRTLFEQGLTVAPVEEYSLRRDGDHASRLIVGYSHLSEAEMEQGLAILRNVLQARGEQA